MSLGFTEAGYKNLFAIEINPEFAKTYSYNFPSHNLIVNDIRNVKTDDISRLIKNATVDIIIGGPPCQGFSIAGNIGRTFLDDERNFLFKEFVRFVDTINPKAFVMENVAALSTHLKGKTIAEIENEFRNAGNGYIVSKKVINTADYGIPQERRRTVIVGIRQDFNIMFDFNFEKQQQVSIKEAIDDLPELKSGQRSEIPNHIAMNHSEQMLHKMSFIKDGGNRFDIPEDIRPKSGDVRKYIRYDSRKPCVCVTGDMRKIFHYEQNRALTPRELARIQSFPDSFIFQGNSISIQQQIGNAVPPKLAFMIAQKLEECLKIE